MLSLGIERSRAFCTAVARAGLASVSPPPSRAATVIARASFVNCWPRLASTAAFRCLIDDHLECPDTEPIVPAWEAAHGVISRTTTSAPRQRRGRNSRGPDDDSRRVLAVDSRPADLDLRRLEDRQ